VSSAAHMRSRSSQDACKVGEIMSAYNRCWQQATACKRRSAWKFNWGPHGARWIIQAVCLHLVIRATETSSQHPPCIPFLRKLLVSFWKFFCLLRNFTVWWGYFCLVVSFPDIFCVPCAPQETNQRKNWLISIAIEGFHHHHTRIGPVDPFRDN
jgi:hypothetical protein